MLLEFTYFHLLNITRMQEKQSLNLTFLEGQTPRTLLWFKLLPNFEVSRWEGMMQAHICTHLHMTAHFTSQSWYSWRRDWYSLERSISKSMSRSMQSGSESGSKLAEEFLKRQEANDHYKHLTKKPDQTNKPDRIKSTTFPLFLFQSKLRDLSRRQN